MYLHNPTHIFMDDTLYFITAAIYQKHPLLKEPAIKDLLLNCIQSSFNQYQWELHHWVILDNPYHVLAKSRKGDCLSTIIQQIHSVSGYHIKRLTKVKNRVWWNYWDYCPRDETDYFVHLNYLFNNPVKHGYVTQLCDYPYSSFNVALERSGRDLLVNQFKQYTDYKNLVLYEDEF